MEGNDASFICKNIYINLYNNVKELEAGLEGWFAFYNHERPHQSLSYRTPAEVYHNAQAIMP
nr:integrase core domain-containing protein [Tautonia rosea]